MCMSDDEILDGEGLEEELDVPELEAELERSR